MMMSVLFGLALSLLVALTNGADNSTSTSPTSTSTTLSRVNLDMHSGNLLWVQFTLWNYTGPESDVSGEDAKCPKLDGVIRCNELGELTGVVLSGAPLNGSKLEDAGAGQTLLLRAVTSLQMLKLDGTGMTGTLPREALGDLHRMHTLWLNDNAFQGPVPDDLFFDAQRSAPIQLTSLRLHNNQLVGQVPALIAESRNLTEFTVYGNHLRGALPAGFPSGLSTCQLVGAAATNCFSCPLPADLPAVCDGVCSGTCGAVGAAPTAPPTPPTPQPRQPTPEPPPAAPTPVPVGPVFIETHQATLVTLMFNRWSVPADVVPAGGVHSVTCPQSSGPVQCDREGQLTGIELSGVPLTGVLENLEEGVHFLFRAMTSLQALLLDGCGLSGSLPAAALADLHQLHTVHLNDNNFTGPVPEDLFYDRLQRSPIDLVSLRLHNNWLTGELPAAAIARATSLREFTVHNNRLTGAVPTTLPAGLSECALGGARRPLNAPRGNCFACPVPTAQVPSTCAPNSIVCNWCIPPPTASPTYAPRLVKSPGPAVARSFDFFPVVIGVFAGVCLTGTLVAAVACVIIRRRAAEAGRARAATLPVTGASGTVALQSMYSRSRSASRARVSRQGEGFARHSNESRQSVLDYKTVTSGQDHGHHRRSRSASRSTSRHSLSHVGGMSPRAHAGPFSLEHTRALGYGSAPSAPIYDRAEAEDGGAAGTVDSLELGRGGGGRGATVTSVGTPSSIYSDAPPEIPSSDSVYSSAEATAAAAAIAARTRTQAARTYESPPVEGYNENPSQLYSSSGLEYASTSEAGGNNNNNTVLSEAGAEYWAPGAPHRVRADTTDSVAF